MKYNQTKLLNGINLLTCQMPGFNSVVINVIINVGSRHENIDNQGICHFLEHMAFKGTRTKTAQQIAEEFDSIGGQFNAYTSKECTVFYAKILAEHTSQALAILADIIQNSNFDPTDIDVEKEVIFQEIAGAYDNQDELVYDKLFEVSYPNQAIGRSILGTKDSLAEFNQDILKKFIDKHYNASNITISLAGFIDHDDVFKHCNQYFKYVHPKPVSTFEKANYHCGYININKDLEQNSLMIAYPSISFSNIEQYYQNVLIAVILGGGVSSRLFQNIREKAGLVYTIGTSINSFLDSGLFLIYAGVSPSNCLKVYELINENIYSMIETCSEDELMRAKTQVKSNILMSEEKVSYKAEEIAKSFMTFNKFISTKYLLDLIENCSIAAIKIAAKELFANKPSIAIVGPKFDDSKLKVNY